MITQAEVQDLFRYDTRTGDLYWRKSGKGRNTRVPAGSRQSNVYWSIRVKYKLYLAHHLVWLYHTGSLPEKELDHINGNSFDNKIENLREVSRGINNFNKARKRAANTSGTVGVCFAERWNTWNAYIGIDGKRIHLGAFPTKEKAIEARKYAETKFYPGETR